MPPKKAEPEPVVEECVPEPPKLTPEETLAKAMGYTLNKSDKKKEVLMDRSTALTSDPKMKEINATLCGHAASLQAAKVKLSTVARRSETLRTGGCGMVDIRMREIEHGAPVSLVRERPGLEKLGSDMEAFSRPSSPVSQPPQAARESHRTAPEEEDAMQEVASRRLARFSKDSSKVNYRDYTDKTMKRLLLDMDLARDSERQRHYQHQTRCDHLDKSYSFYKHWTLKEEKKKTAPAPPYLRFSQEGPVAPGSMRVNFRQTSPLLSSHPFGHSASSPSLLTASAGL